MVEIDLVEADRVAPKRTSPAGAAFCVQAPALAAGFRYGENLPGIRARTRPAHVRRCISSNARKTSTRCFFSITRSACSNSRTTALGFRRCWPLVVIYCFTCVFSCYLFLTLPTISSRNKSITGWISFRDFLRTCSHALWEALRVDA